MEKNIRYIAIEGHFTTYLTNYFSQMSIIKNKKFLKMSQP